MGRTTFTTKIRIVQVIGASWTFFLCASLLNAECISGNCANGRGDFIAKAGERILFKYSGEWKNGVFEGKGVRIFFDRKGRKSSEYEGSWSQGKRNGPGSLKSYLDGIIDSECHGSWSKNELHGEGKCTYYSRGRKIAILESKWSQGIVSGKGTYTRFSLNGKVIARIQAHFRGDYAKGTLWEYENGKVLREYNGELLNFAKHGLGTLKYSDGRVEKGTWVRGKLVSK